MRPHAIRMKRGFYTIMSAQFFSSLADNALFVAAVELLRAGGAPNGSARRWCRCSRCSTWCWRPSWAPSPTRMPKGKVMFVSNAIKVVGCLMMLFGTHPLLAYAIVGLGAAAYSPAKYGILTELLPPSQLVKANGWIEGLTIASIILGVLLGGQLVGHAVSSTLLAFDLPLHRHRHRHAARSGHLRADLRLRAGGLVQHPHPAHRRRDAAHAEEPAGAGARLLELQLAPVARQAGPDLAGHHHAVLGRVAATCATSCWPGARRRWATAPRRPRRWCGVVAIGTAVGAVVASMRMRLDKATTRHPAGHRAWACWSSCMNFISNVWVAAPFLILLGGLGGFLVVPMNALLQHRGHNLMGAGRSIAVQNFNEQACILGLGAFYSLSAGMGLSAFGAITAFGIVVAGVMWMIQRWHAQQLRQAQGRSSTTCWRSRGTTTSHG